MNHNNYITLIDFYSVFYKSILSAKINELRYNGQITGGMYNILRTYKKIIKDYKNTLFCIDKITTNKRKEIYPNYKANRDLSKYEERGYNISKWKNDFFNCIPMKIAHHPELEADDVINSIIYHINNSSLKNVFHEILVITGDSDLWVLKDKNVKIINIKNDYNEIIENDIIEKFGLNNHKHILIYKSLFGDPSDNIESSLPKGTRKKKYIEFINNNNNNSLKNDLLNTFDNINKIQFEINYSIVSLFTKNITDLIINETYGSDELYQVLKNEYGFFSLGPFNEFNTYLDINNNNLNKYLFNKTSQNETILNDIL